ncbi:subfamily B ATP-binding cassette protein MsbA [Lewinella aquimaris]|uniref:Subfamily B ATP-binding cassette protein MsbA n=1 Tax=Neolewinella aquimaris TaxID=1835722 RepID=A0A840E8I1_9BACT|nr:ABC transporter ATP-binding protein [Neolewinella aquimaris]MBB4080243.1 subfamily B ATP-binding cassette protein MsbA [Neolewinella aquimaris]
MSLLVAIMDGFGLAMFLPLLQLVSNGSMATGERTGEMGFILEHIEAIGFRPDLTTVLLFLLMFFTLKGVARFGLDYYRVILQQRFANALRLRNLNLLVGASYGKFADAHSGTIQNTLSSEVVRVNQAYLNYFQLLQYLVMTIVYAVLAYLANPRFAAIVVVGGLLSNVAFKWINRTTRAASSAISRGMNVYQGLLIESVASFKYLKATGLLERFSRKVSTTIREAEAQQRRIGLMNAVTYAVREPLIVLVVVTAIFVQLMVFGEGIGLIILSLLFFYRALTSITAVQSCYNQFLGYSGSIGNLIAFTEEMKGGQEPPGSKPFTGLRDRIEVSHLDFRYRDKQVLKDLSVQINKYDTIGIAGESGSGKTTLVNLVTALLQPAAGMIRVDGVDVTEIVKEDYRRRIGYVTQEAQVFSGTIHDNVALWDGSDKNDEPVWEALRLAHAAEFVRSLPDGISTRIGINGINLSGGQRQRIAIARELYRKVDILILDEATSALDSQSEKLIQDNIDHLAGTLTLIVIAHRLSTLRKVDKIVFLRVGGDHEVDTFANLLKSSGDFRKMVALQAV